MKKLSYIIIALAVVLTGCKDGDSDLDKLIDDYEKQTEVTVEPVEISLNRDAISEQTEVIPTESDDPDYFNDYIENSSFSRTVYVNYNGENAEVSGDVADLSVSVNGAHVVIRSTKSGVCYKLTGKSDNGSFKVYSDRRFQINANGLSLTNPFGAAINSQSGKTMYFVTEGNEVTLTDGKEYSRTPSGEDEKATLFSEGQIVFSGTGLLTITSNSKNAIASDDYVRFRVGTNIYLVSMAGHGLKTNDGVFINGGVLNILVKGDGMKGINSEDDIVVNGGRTTIITSGSTKIMDNDTTSTAAIKCDSVLTINNGELRLLTSGNGSKGINVNTNMVMNGGSLFVVNNGNNDVAKSKGVKVDGDLNINGGHFYVYCKSQSKLDVKGNFRIANGYKSRQEVHQLFELIY